MRKALGLGLFLLGASMAGPARAGAPENFDMRSAADLVAACSVTPTDAVSSAQVGFCHGFMVGVYRTLEEVQAARPSARMFCPSGTMPSRNEAIAAYVSWANARPDELAKVPQESVADYLAATYPCPAASEPSPSPSRRRTR